MDFSASFDTEEVINLYTFAYDGAWEKSTRRYNKFKRKLDLASVHRQPVEFFFCTNSYGRKL